MMKSLLAAGAMLVAASSTSALSATISAACKIDGEMLVMEATNGLDYEMVCLVECNFVEQAQPQIHTCNVTLPGGGSRSCMKMVKPETTVESKPASMICTTVNRHTTF